MRYVPRHARRRLRLRRAAPPRAKPPPPDDRGVDHLERETNRRSCRVFVATRTLSISAPVLYGDGAGFRRAGTGRHMRKLCRTPFGAVFGAKMLQTPRQCWSLPIYFRPRSSIARLFHTKRAPAGNETRRTQVSAMLFFKNSPSIFFNDCPRRLHMMLDLIHAGAPMATTFFASAVEAVEAATVVLAAGVVRGRPPPLSGAMAGLGVLAVIGAVFGTAIAAVPITVLQVVVGTLLLLFGIRWLRKAMLRAAGVIALRDEEALYVREQVALGASGASGDIAKGQWDTIAALTSFKAVLL